MANEQHSEQQRGGSGNFANDPGKASEAGRKGGEHSHGAQSQDIAKDREKASEAGKKGGEHSHGAR